MKDKVSILLSLFDAALGAADPLRVLPVYLPPMPTQGRVFIAGLGKAAARMAQAVEAKWPNLRPPGYEGLIVTRYGHGLPLKWLRLLEAGHPLPDQNSFVAGRALLGAAQNLQEGELFLLLLSGGGSALADHPPPNVTPDDFIALNQLLLAAGMAINDINLVRKHVSAFKGGQLAAAVWPARCLTLAISDVPGDDPAIIASGPTVADSSTSADASAALRRYGISAPASIARHLAAGQHETPKPGDVHLSRADYHLVARPASSLAAAVDHARSQGYDVLMLGDDLQGEARDLGSAHAHMAQELRDQGWRGVIISGGETVVTLKQSHGRGGRNGEYLLEFFAAISNPRGIAALACDTDGIDGSEDNAGAAFSADHVLAARDQGLNALDYLARHDSYGFFDALGALIVTGPTHTNVNDFRAILVDPT